MDIMDPFSLINMLTLLISLMRCFTCQGAKQEPSIQRDVSEAEKAAVSESQYVILGVRVRARD